MCEGIVITLLFPYRENIFVRQVLQSKDSNYISKIKLEFCVKNKYTGIQVTYIALDYSL